MADAVESATKTLTAQCYCKAVHFTLVVPKASLPLKVHLCHCSVCRYTHGTPCIFHAPLPEVVAPKFVSPSSLSNLTGYEHAEAKSTRYFCSTCGCQIGDVSVDDDEGWVIASSIFDSNPDDWRIGTHVNTKSAPDGGLSDWLPKIGDRDMRVWNPADEKENVVVVSEPEVGEQGEERLRAQCHCGGVSFTIPRPSPELLLNEHTKSFVSPIDPNKWVACLDVCDDCRLLDGTHVVAWTFVPLNMISPPVGPDLQIGTSKTLASSSGVLRSFCGTCGATVFFLGKGPEDAPLVVDIAVGILRAPEGIKAENWLTWRAGRLAWADSGRRYDAEFTDSLADGLGAWSKEKYGSAPTFNIGT